MAVGRVDRPCARVVWIDDDLTGRPQSILAWLRRNIRRPMRWQPMLFSRGIDDGHTFFRIGFCNLAMELRLIDWLAAVVHMGHTDEHVGSNQFSGKLIIEFVRHG